MIVINFFIQKENRLNGLFVKKKKKKSVYNDKIQHLHFVRWRYTAGSSGNYEKTTKTFSLYLIIIYSLLYAYKGYARLKKVEFCGKNVTA